MAVGQGRLNYSIAELVHMARLAMHDGRPNVTGLRIPLQTNWNLHLFNSLCTSAADREVAAYLRYGWPLNQANAPLPKTMWNHRSAEENQSQVTQCILKEMKEGTIMGPFVTTPFEWKDTGISPMSTRPKKQSEKRRILVDLSWPPWSHSVNSAIPKDYYMGTPITLKYPTIDMLCARATRAGPKILGWKKDMSRAFRQIYLQPSSWVALGVTWLSALFFERAAVMGARISLYICQRTTSSIRHFMANISYIIHNYVDDFMGINLVEQAWDAYNTLGNLLTRFSC